MASSASDLIKFEKMATGEKSGTWGTLANTAMSRIEESIAGFRAITLAGSTYPLDDTQYLENSTTTSESHLAMIKAVGSPGASRQITVPLRTKLYLFWNAVTTYDMTVAAASGDSVTITNGNLAWVFCDGTNVELASPMFTTTGIINASALPAASLTAVGGIEVATVAETNTGSDATRAVSPDGLDGWTGSAQVATVGTITSGAWTGTDVAVAAGGTGSSTASGARTNLGLVIGTDVLDEDDTSIGQHTIWVPAAAMEAAVTTAAATSNAVEIGTSLFAARTMDFATGADDFCYFGIQMPKSWGAGTLVCQFVWSATGTTANTVLWGIAATSLGDDEVLTTAFAAPTLATLDTNSTTADDLMVSAEVTLTVGSSPTAEDYVIFEVSRDVSGDTLAEDARLHGIKIHYTTDTGSDT